MCGAAEILNPMSRDQHNITVRRCANVSIPRNIPKVYFSGTRKWPDLALLWASLSRTLPTGEYKGEVLGTQEVDRRGLVLRSYAYGTLV